VLGEVTANLRQVRIDKEGIPAPGSDWAATTLDAFETEVQREVEQRGGCRMKNKAPEALR
jgi:hypothetical protein